MPDIEENEDGKLESDASDAQPQEANDAAPENTEPEASPAPAPATKQAIMYGTRKRRPGAESAPAAKTLNQIRGPVEEDDDIEMDDLVIRSTAPDHLIEGEKSDSPKGRGRRERSRQPKEEAPQEEALDNDIEAYPEDEPSQETSSEDGNRPERFGKLKDDHRPRQRAVEEFRPSKDGKRSAPKKRARSEEVSNKPVEPKPKKGFFAWLKSLFGIEEQPKKQDKRRSNRGSNQRRRRRGGQNRSKGEGFDGNRSRGGRRKGRGNRTHGEGGPKGEGNGQGGNRRRRRRRKPQGERKQQSAE